MRTELEIRERLRQLEEQLPDFAKLKKTVPNTGYDWNRFYRLMEDVNTVKWVLGELGDKPAAKTRLVVPMNFNGVVTLLDVSREGFHPLSTTQGEVEVFICGSDWVAFVKEGNLVTTLFADELLVNYDVDVPIEKWK